MQLYFSKSLNQIPNINSKLQYTKCDGAEEPKINNFSKIDDNLTENKRSIHCFKSVPPAMTSA